MGGAVQPGKPKWACSQKPAPSRYGIWIVFLLVCALGAAYALALDWTVQGYDDAGYILIARSLAAGTGYRIASDQTSWAVTTPLLPFLLAPIWFLRPQLPYDVVWFKIVPLACALLSVPVLFSYFVRARRVPAAVALAIAALSLLSPPTFIYAARMVMTELPYLLLSATALLLAHRTLVERVRSRWMWAALGLALAATGLTRTVGLMLVAGALAYLLWQRRWQVCLVLALLVAALLLPWQLYSRAQGDSVVAPNQYQSDFLLRDYGNPELGYIESYWEIVPRLFHNAAGHLDDSLPHLFMPGLTGDRLLSLLQRSGLGWLKPAFGVGLAVIIGLGWAISWRRGVTLLEFYIPLYIGMILMPPWYASRNLVPIAPFLLYYLWVGLQAAGEWLARWSPDLGRGARAARVALFVAMLISILASDRHLIRQGVDARAGRFPAWEQNYYEAGDWLRVNAPASASVAAPIPYKMALYLDRPVQNPDHVPVEPVVTGQGLPDFIVVQPERPLVKYEGPMGQAVAQFVREHPERCTLVFTSRQSPYAQVYDCARR